jgi:hypothetical protein
LLDFLTKVVLRNMLQEVFDGNMYIYYLFLSIFASAHVARFSLNDIVHAINIAYGDWNTVDKI